MTPLALTPPDLAAENARLRARIVALETVMLELIGERDRAVKELERMQRPLFVDAEDRSVRGRTL